MKMHISSDICISEYNNALRDYLIGRCTFPNPEYETMLNLGKWVGHLPRELKYYEMTGEGLRIPRGLLRDIIELYNPDEFVDNRTYLKDTVDIKMKDTISLRPYQMEAIETALRRAQGILTLPTGAGKTLIGTAVAVSTKSPILWITHTKDLLQQSKRAFLKYTDIKEEDIGIIGGGKYSIGKVTIATIQSLIKYSELYDSFGCVIVDEAHHAGADTWGVIGKFTAKYRIALTATPYRSDGKTGLLFVLLGRELFNIPGNKLVEMGYIMKPELRVLTRVIKDTNGEYISGKENYDVGNDNNRFMRELTYDQERNDLLAEITTKLLEERNKILVLTDRVEHAKALMGRIKAYSGKTVYPLFKDNQMTFDTSVDKYVIVATYQKAEEGLDIPPLDGLVLATPTTEMRRIVQSVGRIRRPLEGKDTPIVYDIYDDDIGISRGKFKKRSVAYESMDININYIN